MGGASSVETRAPEAKEDEMPTFEQNRGTVENINDDENPTIDKSSAWEFVTTIYNYYVTNQRYELIVSGFSSLLRYSLLIVYRNYRYPRRLKPTTLFEARTI
jgi:uncharacterized membrane protein